MKIKAGYSLHETADRWIVVPSENNPADQKSVVTLSSSAALLWKALEEGVDSVAQLVALLTSEYTIDHKTALRDSDDFIGQLMAMGLIE